MVKGALVDKLQPELVCTARIFTLSPHFTKADQALADLTISHPQTVIKMSARELGKQCDVSEASVIRFVQKLGYVGLTEFKEALKQELLTSQTTASSGTAQPETPAEVLANVVATCSHALQNLNSILDTEALKRTAEVLQQADVIHFFAAGGSVYVAQHAVFKLMRMGFLAVANTEFYTQMAQATLLTPQSVAFGISFTGSTRSVCDALSVAHESGAATICLTNFAGTPITNCADIELITGAPGGVLAANSAQARVVQFAVLDTLFALMRLRNGDHKDAQNF